MYVFFKTGLSASTPLFLTMECEPLSATSPMINKETLAHGVFNNKKNSVLLLVSHISLRCYCFTGSTASRSYSACCLKLVEVKEDGGKVCQPLLPQSISCLYLKHSLTCIESCRATIFYALLLSIASFTLSRRYAKTGYITIICVCLLTLLLHNASVIILC